jgi:type IV secretion system protein VirB6
MPITDRAQVLVIGFRGYRMVSGQSQESMMTTVSHMIKISLIVVAAKTVAVTGTGIFQFFNTTLPQEINYIVTGSTGSVTGQIDRNLLKVSAAMSAIDMVQVPTSDPALAAEKSHASLVASLGIAAPAMTAGALILLYQIAMAMIMGLAPLFILCLIFDQTKELFRRWLMFLLSTLFSMAMLNLVISWTLDLTERVAGALWATDILTRMTGLAAQGFSTQAFQQGGVGLIMTVLIVSTPPMAGMLFNSTLGNFMYAPAVDGGNRSGSHMGSNGQQVPGGYGGGGIPLAGSNPSRMSHQANPLSLSPRLTAQPANPDVIKTGGKPV